MAPRWLSEKGWGHAFHSRLCCFFTLLGKTTDSWMWWNCETWSNLKGSLSLTLFPLGRSPALPAARARVCCGLLWLVSQKAASVLWLCLHVRRRNLAESSRDCCVRLRIIHSSRWHTHIHSLAWCKTKRPDARTPTSCDAGFPFKANAAQDVKQLHQLPDQAELNINWELFSS
jgi:hypothetical protein